MMLFQLKAISHYGAVGRGSEVKDASLEMNIHVLFKTASRFRKHFDYPDAFCATPDAEPARLRQLLLTFSQQE
jgi:hypothetical protein